MKQQIDAEVATWKEDWKQRIHQAEADAGALAAKTGDVRQGRRYFLEQWELMMGQLKGQLERQAAAQKEKIQEKKKRKEYKDSISLRRLSSSLSFAWLSASSLWACCFSSEAASRD